MERPSSEIRSRTLRPNQVNRPRRTSSQSYRTSLKGKAHSKSRIRLSRKAKPRSRTKTNCLTPRMYVEIAHYVQANCKDDLATFLSSGFVPASSTKTPPQPLDQPSIRQSRSNKVGSAVN